MKLLMRSDVQGVGKKGDIVDVSDGYARNFLVPKGFAILASPGVEKQAEQIRSVMAIVFPEAVTLVREARQGLQ